MAILDSISTWAIPMPAIRSLWVNSRMCSAATRDSARFEIEFQWSPTGALEDAATYSARYMKGSAGAADLAYLRILRVGRPGRRDGKARQTRHLSPLAGQRTPQAAVKARPFAPSDPLISRPRPCDNWAATPMGSQPLAPKLLRPSWTASSILGPLRRLAQRDYVWTRPHARHYR